MGVTHFLVFLFYADHCQTCYNGPHSGKHIEIENSSHGGSIRILCMIIKAISKKMRYPQMIRQKRPM